MAREGLSWAYYVKAPFSRRREHNISGVPNIIKRRVIFLIRGIMNRKGGSRGKRRNEPLADAQTSKRMPRGIQQRHLEINPLRSSNDQEGKK